MRHTIEIFDESFYDENGEEHIRGTVNGKEFDCFHEDTSSVITGSNITPSETEDILSYICDKKEGSEEE